MEEKIRIEEVLRGERRIPLPDKKVFQEVKRRWDEAAMPLDALGRFKEITAQIGAIQGTADIAIQKKTLIVLCADNGIVGEGVSQTGQDVTLAVSAAMGKGTSNACKMAAKAGVEVIPVDVGINAEKTPDGVRAAKVRRGTRNFAKEPALTTAEVKQAMQAGMDIACEAVKGGSGLLCVGEMGIGNTTTSAALAAAFLHCPVAETVGRGAGLDDKRLQKKRAIVEAAIRRYDLYHAKPLRILECVGGLDICAMAGVLFGAALNRVPVVLDGVISCVAALAAARLVPEAGTCLIASHRPKEPAGERVLKELGLYPVIDAQLTLGEGTGAVMLCTLLDLAMTLYTKPLTFREIGVAPYRRFEGRRETGL